MPDRFILRYLPAARDDLLSILEYIAKDSPSRAAPFVDKLDERIAQLQYYPQLGRVPRHSRLREYGYRILVMESYLVFYAIHGRTIQIHSVIHGSRDLNHFI